MAPFLGASQPEEYMTYADELDSMAGEIYRYMNFNEIQSFQALPMTGKKLRQRLLKKSLDPNFRPKKHPTGCFFYT